MFEVENKIAIVTGGARNIGKEICRSLLLKDCKVCIADIREDIGNETLQEFQKELGIGTSRFKSMLVIFLCNKDLK